jgi:hypothetical protein
MNSIPAPRGVAIFLLIGGMIWVAFLVSMRVHERSLEVFVPTCAITALWALRAFNLGSPPVWILIWALSILWHAFLLFCETVILAVLTLFAFGPLAIPVGAIPILWTLAALVLSIGSLCSEIRLGTPPKTAGHPVPSPPSPFFRR